MRQLSKNSPFSALRNCAMIAGLFILGVCADSVRLPAAETVKSKPTAVEARPVVEPFKPTTVVSGTARERGIAYGKKFRAGIQDFLKNEIYESKKFKGISTKEELLMYAADCSKVVSEMSPLIATEIEGIAVGAEIDPREAVLIQLHEELYHKAKVPMHGHCTAVAVSTKDSGNGHAYVGQTWDWMTWLGGASFVTEWQRGDEAPSMLAYGYAGLPSGAGMNSSGIAITWTSAALSQTGLSPRVGMPSYALIAHLLTQTDIESVIREVEKDKHAGWFTFVINDAKGNIVNVEGSPKGVVVERAKDFIVRADYGSSKKQEEMKSVKRWVPAERCAVFDKLMKETAGKNDLATLQKYLTEPKLGIASPYKPGNMTIDVMLFDTTAKKAYMSRGPGFGIEWREFEFSAAK